MKFIFLIITMLAQITSQLTHVSLLAISGQNATIENRVQQEIVVNCTDPQTINNYNISNRQI